MSRSISVFFAAVLSFIAAPLAATTIVMPTDDQLIDKSGTVVIGTVQHVAPIERNGTIYTEAIITVEQLLKGSTVAPSITVREIGGRIGERFNIVFGNPEFATGERVLLFLGQASDGSYRTKDLFVGKFTEKRTRRGEKVWHRSEDHIGTQLLDRNGNQLPPGREVARERGAFERYIVERGNGRKQAPQYHVEVSDAELTATSGSSISASFTLISEPTIYRWFAFERGQTATWYSVGTQPGYGDGGISETRSGMGAWTSYSGANIRFSYGGASPQSVGGLSSPNGVNEVVLNDPLNEIEGSYSANSGGVVGRGGFNNTGSGGSWTSTFTADASHPARTFSTTYNIIEGNLVIQNGVSPSSGISSTLLAEIIAHEFGHTLGIGHSSDGTALMYATLSGGGPTLRADDQTAARWLYPATGGSTPTPPPTCTAPAITSQPQSTTVAAGTNVTLSVSASGSSLSYTWYYGRSGDTNIPIAGATGPTLTVSRSETTNYWVRVFNACGSVNSATATVTITAAANATYPRVDFNGDGRTDLLWRNTLTGDNHVWTMSGAAYGGTLYLRRVVDQEWKIETAADFNRDGKSDLLWRNHHTGENHVWLMNGSTYVTSVALRTVVGNEWRVQGSGDFNGDGHIDLLWRNYTSGENHVWLLNGTTYVGSAVLTPLAGNANTIAGVGDFNGDAKPDIVWRNTATGQNSVWLMNGTTRSSSVTIRSVAPSAWSLDAVCDLNNDGWTDLIWRNRESGANHLWVMNGTTYAGSTELRAVVDSIWTIAGPR